MGLESFLSSLIFKTVLFGIQGKVQEWFRVTARVRESVILSLDNRSFLWCDLLFFVHLFFCGKPHEGHQHQKPFCISLLCEGWLKRKHSNTNFSVALFTVVQYFWSFLSLLLISFSSWHVWRSRNTSKARHPGIQAAIHCYVHPYYYSQKWAAGTWPHLFWCPLLWLFIFSVSASVKAALRSATPIPALHILAWAPVEGWVSLYEARYRQGAAWLVRAHLGPGFLPLHSHAERKTLSTGHLRN